MGLPTPAYRPAVCAACANSALDFFFETSEVPQSIALKQSLDAARHCGKGDIQLGFCSQCGAISNVVFDDSATTYNEYYDNSLFFSPTFQKYSEGQARRLVERYDLHGKTIVSVGCGNGEFLSMLCSLGNNHGIGFDPSFIPGRVNLQVGRRIEIIKDYYREEHAQQAADFVVCQQVLEHFSRPRPLLRTIRKALGSNANGAVLFETPNASFVFEQTGIWDVIYEHCFYYDSSALGRLVSSCGFDVLNISKTFAGQYLALEARPSLQDIGEFKDLDSSIGAMRTAIQGFRNTFRSRLSYWQGRFDDWTRQGKRVAVWGAGAKAVMFLNRFRDARCLCAVVDVNPHKHGFFVPCVGMEVLAPQDLRKQPPDVVVIMNANYQEEIRGQLQAWGIVPDLVVV